MTKSVLGIKKRRRYLTMDELDIMEKGIPRETCVNAPKTDFTVKDDSLHMDGGLEGFYDELTGILTWA